MSINKLISIKNPIIDALDMMAVDHDKHIPMLMVWATLAEKEIGGSNVVRKWKVLDVCGIFAELPCDISYIEGAIFGNHGCECSGLFNKIFIGKAPYIYGTNDSPFLIVDVFPYGNNGQCNIINYGIQDNKLVFEACLNQDHITIQYMGYETDCDGFLMVGQNHVEAITEFLTYKWLKRKRRKTNADMNEMNMAYREWSRLCAHARALDAELNPSERQEVSDMINDPYAGKSLAAGMRINGNYGGLGY